MSDEITSVLVDPYALAPASVRYPKGYVCSVVPEQSVLMSAAAKALTIEIHFGDSPRPDRMGVYVRDFEKDPVDLLDLFTTLQIAVSNWRKRHEAKQPADSPAHPAARTDPRD